MKKASLVLVSLLVFAFQAKAQENPEYRLEIGVGVGTMGYLGDFNGNLAKDMQPMFSVTGRYVFNPWMALRMGICRGKLKGSSGDVETYYPDYADVSYDFSNALYDLSLTYEYNFLPYGTGWDYRGAKRFTPFLYAGLGLTYVETPNKGRVAFNVPIGLGVKYKLADRVNVGLEWALHFAQSDWLDGVKDPYYIKSSGLFKNTDCYSALQLTVTYSFSPKCVNCNKE